MLVYQRSLSIHGMRCSDVRQEEWNSYHSVVHHESQLAEGAQLLQKKDESFPVQHRSDDRHHFLLALWNE